MKIITCNIFHHSFFEEERMVEFIKYIKIETPDIIALQEVTQSLLTLITNGLKDIILYGLISTDLHEKLYGYTKPFGLVILFNKNTIIYNSHILDYYKNSVNFREYIIADFTIKKGKYDIGLNFLFCTSHLESESIFYTERKWQFNYIIN